MFDQDDLNLLDGLRGMALIWIMYLGICALTFNGAVYNLWSLDAYLKDINYVAVYSSNMAYDEFFMISAFF